MVSPTLAPVRSRGRRIVLGVAGALLTVAIVALLGVCVWFYLLNRRALPQVDGTVRMAGLSAPVTVIRDGRGMPHIRAANVADLVFAQGYVTAQDRLWEMDMMRRDGGGELSEILGPQALTRDKQQHTLGTQLIAQRALAAMPPENRAFLEAYARGVNAFIDSHRNSLPTEFRVLGYQPQPWRPEDSLLIGISMGEMLNFAYIRDMLAREKVSAKVGPQLAADLYPTTSWRDIPPAASAPPIKEMPKPPPMPETRLRPAERPMQVAGAPPALQQDCGIYCADDMRAGSNDWVVSGEHTATGKPMLSNDMHLPHQIPNIWYEAHLTAGDFDVAGVTLPGVPFVIVGHNRRIAWGFTNINPQVTDLYIETVNDDRYQTPDGWKPLEHRREVIHVKGQPDVVLDVRSTRHGPIITAGLPGETRPIALRATMFDPAALQFPFYGVNQAQNWDEFREAFSHFGLPGQNVVYGDVDGHIGYESTGFVPLRKSPATGLPVPGNTNDNEWTGYIPWDQMPRVFDPESGILATANGRITPDDYPFFVSAEWEAPFRTDRIYHFLQTHEKLTAADMLALQTDISSVFDRFCAERFVYGVDHAKNVSARTREAAEIMRKWDGRMTADSAAAVIETRARTRLLRELLRPKLGGDTSEYHWPMQTQFLENVLLRRPARWLPPAMASYDDLLANAVGQVVDAKDAPGDLRSWNWGKESPIELRHLLFGRIPILKYFAGPGLQPQSGGRYTVKQVGRTFGPSERLTVDFSDLDHSTLNIVSGETDNLLSPHFNDQWSAWYEGHTFPLPFSSEAVDRDGRHTLTLQPQ